MSSNVWKGVACAVLVLTTSGCLTPLRQTQAGTYESTLGPAPGFQRQGVLKQVVLYIPNRVVDLLDIVKVGLGVGLNLGPDIRLTKWIQVAAQVGVGAGVQWDGRDHQPGNYAAQATAAFGPWRTGSGAGLVPSIRPFEVAIAGAGGKFGVDLAEAVDFVLGWFFIDILQDDYGWTR